MWTKRLTTDWLSRRLTGTAPGMNLPNLAMTSIGNIIIVQKQGCQWLNNTCPLNVVDSMVVGSTKILLGKVPTETSWNIKVSLHIGPLLTFLLDCYDPWKTLPNACYLPEG